jgi:hypothetical protein
VCRTQALLFHKLAQVLCHGDIVHHWAVRRMTVVALVDGEDLGTARLGAKSASSRRSQGDCGDARQHAREMRPAGAIYDRRRPAIDGPLAPLVPGRDRKTR